MRKLGQEAADAAAARAARRAAARARGRAAGALRRTGRSSPTPSTRRASAPASPALLRRLGEHGHRVPRPADPRRARWRRSSSAWSRARGHEPGYADPRHLPLRDGAHLAHADAEHRLAGAVTTSLYFVVFGSAIGSRMARDRRRQLRRVHRAGPHHALHPDREHLERLLRHLHAALLRHDLRGAVGARLGARDRAGLCRRGGHEVGDPGPRSSWPRRGSSCRSTIAHPVWMAGVPGADAGHVQPVRLHHRHLGRRAGRSCRSCR